MPEEEKNNEPMVDIDTSGPEVEVNVEEKEDKTYENERESKLDDNNKSDNTSEKSDEQLDVQVSEEKKEETEKEETTDKKKEELEDYSDGVKKRIAKLTKKWREAERQKEAALEYARGVQAERKQLASEVNRLEPSYIDAMEGKVVSGLQAAQAKLVQARENNDIKSEVEAQKAIAQLGLEEQRVVAIKQRADQFKASEQPRQTLEQAVAPPQTPPDPKAEDWAEKNPWFGQDSAMTYSAFDLHKKLTEEEGFDPKSDEYYAEVDKRMRLDFPHKFAKTEQRETTKPTQTVASATRKVTNSGRKTVRLTPSQVTIAKKLGVPLELYAKQLNITKER